jgi:GTP-binding protein
MFHLPQFSATTHPARAVREIISGLVGCYEAWNIRIPTGELNRWLRAVTSFRPPHKRGGKAVTIRYATQVDTRPPTFALFTNRPGALGDDYVRFLTKSLRAEFALEGVPLRVYKRMASTNPFAKFEKKRPRQKKRYAGAKRQGY